MELTSRSSLAFLGKFPKNQAYQKDILSVFTTKIPSQGRIETHLATRELADPSAAALARHSGSISRKSEGLANRCLPQS
jgi:hypothetical protein